MVEERDVPVLIVGGSLVGLSTAVFLGHQGVETLVVERHPGTAIYPRAASLQQGSVEMFRHTGLEDGIRNVAVTEFVQNGGTVSVESLIGTEHEWFHPDMNQGGPGLSPSLGLHVSQVALEPVLVDHVENSGSQVLFGSQVVDVDQHADGVRAVVRDRATGAEQVVNARYVIAADGNRSPIRERLGIPWIGHGVFSHSITIYFEADVKPALGGRNPTVVYFVNDQFRGFGRFPRDGAGGFVAINAARNADGEWRDDFRDDIDETRAVAFVRAALGDPDLPVTVNTIQHWLAAASYAERMSEGRIFLVGDSAHAMPPTGGFGGNTGVHDAFNLAWKLAWVLDGRAGAGLLDTYDVERQPLSAARVEQAYERYLRRLEPRPEPDRVELTMIDKVCLDLGGRHLAVGEDRPMDHAVLFEDPRTPSASVGFRVPHVPLRLAGGESSTIDLVGTDFVLFTGADGDAWREPTAKVSADLGIEIAAPIPEDGEWSGHYEELLRLGSGGAVLVRPDGVICWRADGAPGANGANDLREALARVLDLDRTGGSTGAVRQPRL